MRKIPEYKNVPSEKLPPYQLFKRWQKATHTSSMEQFGWISGDKMLLDIKQSEATK